MAPPRTNHTGIYIIENLQNGRRYVGSAMRFNKRWKEHARGLDRGNHHSRFLQREWNKKGADAFEFRVVLLCEPENLLMYEQVFIDFYRPEYNSAPVAGSQLGLKMSDEAKAKMSEAAKRTRNFTGHKHRADSKAKISAAKTGVKHGPYDKDRIDKAARKMRETKSVITESSVRIIRNMNAAGIRHAAIAETVGCSYWVVADIVRNRTFKWVN
jgi:group I intron endonuclease